MSIEIEEQRPWYVVDMVAHRAFFKSLLHDLLFYEVSDLNEQDNCYLIVNTLPRRALLVSELPPTVPIPKIPPVVFTMYSIIDFEKVKTRIPELGGKVDENPLEVKPGMYVTWAYDSMNQKFGILTQP
jgi:hypothetical protein